MRQPLKPEQNSSIEVAFAGVTSYKNDFLNWGIGDKAQINSQNNPTVIKDLPFYSRTMYKDAYGKNKQ